MKDIFIACVDGLKGLPEAIEAVYPQTGVQSCIYIWWGVAQLRALEAPQVGGGRSARIYQAATAEEARHNSRR